MRYPSGSERVEILEQLKKLNPMTLRTDRRYRMNGDIALAFGIYDPPADEVRGTGDQADRWFRKGGTGNRMFQAADYLRSPDAVLNLAELFFQKQRPARLFSLASEYLLQYLNRKFEAKEALALSYLQVILEEI